jgi:Queuine tRNA-ribosyltransferase
MLLSVLSTTMITLFTTVSGYRKFGSAHLARRVLETKKQSLLVAFSTLPENRADLSVKTVEDVKYENFAFELIKQADSSRARLGKVTTPHGTIHTPNFVFCATKAAMKAITPAQLWDRNSRIGKVALTRNQSFTYRRPLTLFVLTDLMTCRTYVD